MLIFLLVFISYLCINDIHKIQAAFCIERLLRKIKKLVQLGLNLGGEMLHALTGFYILFICVIEDSDRLHYTYITPKNIRIFGKKRC